MSAGAEPETDGLTYVFLISAAGAQLTNLKFAIEGVWGCCPNKQNGQDRYMRFCPLTVNGFPFTLLAELTVS